MSRDRHADIAEQFKCDTAKHAMTVLHEDGLYRHIRYQIPSSSFYWFDLITWPGNLTINGDMGTYTFARLDDMFQFFRSDGDRINPTYWSEKVRGDTTTEVYSEALFRQLVADHVSDCAEEYPGLARAVEQDVFRGWDLSSEEDARAALYQFEHKGFRFHDVWEWSFRDYSIHFLWCCHAIQWGIGQYDASRTTEAVSR